MKVGRRDWRAAFKAIHGKPAPPTEPRWKIKTPKPPCPVRHDHSILSPEGKFIEFCTENKITFLRNGWPDFACLKDGKLSYVVEAKGAKERLQPHQEILLSVLERSGIPVFVWRTHEGLKRYKPLRRNVV